MADRRAAAWRARALGRSLPQRLFVVARTRDARDSIVTCAERAARTAGEHELFAVNVAVRDLSFASRAAALVVTERARSTPTTPRAGNYTNYTRQAPVAGICERTNYTWNYARNYVRNYATVLVTRGAKTHEKHQPREGSAHTPGRGIHCSFFGIFFTDTCVVQWEDTTEQYTATRERMSLVE